MPQPLKSVPTSLSPKQHQPMLSCSGTQLSSSPLHVVFAIITPPLFAATSSILNISRLTNGENDILAFRRGCYPCISTGTACALRYHTLLLSKRRSIESRSTLRSFGSLFRMLRTGMDLFVKQGVPSQSRRGWLGQDRSTLAWKLYGSFLALMGLSAILLR